MPQAGESGFPEKTSYTGGESTETDNDAPRFKAAAVRVMQTSKTAAQRWGRESMTAAGQLAGNATGRIKDDPLRSAAVTFGIGLGLGVLIGWRLGRQQSD